MMNQLHDRLTAFLINLELLDNEGCKDAIFNEVVETGGIYVKPMPVMNDSTYLFELRLHGITVVGNGEDAAIRKWKKAASRHLATQFVDDAALADGRMTV